MKKVIAIQLLFLVCGLCSGEDIGGYPGGFLAQGLGAQSLAMGTTGVSNVRTPLSTIYNPAGLLFSENIAAFEANYFALPLDRRIYSVGFSYNIRRDAEICIVWINAGVSNLVGRDSDGNPTGEIRNSENAISLTFDKRAGKFISIGGTIRYVQANLDELTSYSVGGDLGFAINILKGKIKIGGSYRNLGLTYPWNSSKVYEYGASVNDRFPRALQFGLTLNDTFYVPFTVCAEIQKREKANIRLSAGAEIAPVTALKLRAGYSGIKPSLGIAITHPLRKYTIELGYSFIFSPLELPPAHSAGLTIAF